MVAELLRLRVDLTLGSWRLAPSIRIMQAVVLAFIIVVLALSMGSSADWFIADPDRFTLAVSLMALAVSLTFFFAALLGQSQDPLDPRRFFTWFFSRRNLSLSVPLLALLSPWILLCLGFILVIVIASPPANFWQWLIFVFAAALILVQSSLLARCGFAISAKWRWQRYRQFVFGVVLLCIWAPVMFIVFIPDAATATPDLTWLPFAAPWSLLLGSDQNLVLVPVSLLYLALIAAVWVAALYALLNNPSGKRNVVFKQNLGGFAMLPASVSGVIAARSAVYWLRDPRYWINLIIIPLFAVLIVPPFLVAGLSFEIAVLIPVPIVGLYLGWLLHNDLAYDSSALWLHFAAKVSGLSDRWGRVVVPLFFGSLGLVLLSVIATFLSGSWFFLPALLGISFAGFFAALGGSSLTSALTPYAAGLPGNSPFQQPQRSGIAVFYSLVLVLASALLALLPTFLLATLAWSSTSMGVAFLTMLLGVFSGAIILAIGIFFGARAFEARADYLMQFAEINA